MSFTPTLVVIVITSKIEILKPSGTSSESRPVEVYCEECKTVLIDRENPKFCPLCGSSNLLVKTY
ncbi:MAG TPA: hypothetical protein ENH75_07815 [archaeon]|nr:hypothetical protein [archaeon]